MSLRQSSVRLTTRQGDAVDLLLRGEVRSDELHRRLRLDGEPDLWGVVYAGETCLLDGQAWINYRTAHALAGRGLVEMNGWGEDARVRLTNDGRELAHARFG